MKTHLDILIADDHPVYRDGLRQIIAGDASLRVVRETGNGVEALKLLRELRPDVATLDMDMPGMNGLDIARAAQRDGLPTAIIFLTMYREEDMFREAMDIGARGFVLKESAAADIRTSIHAVADGGHYISPALSGFLMHRNESVKGLHREKPGLAALTPAELRILRLIATDKTSKEIADELGLSPRTVDNHRTNMSAKLELHGSHSLLKFAFENRGKL